MIATPSSWDERRLHRIDREPARGRSTRSRTLRRAAASHGSWWVTHQRIVGVDGHTEPHPGERVQRVLGDLATAPVCTWSSGALQRNTLVPQSRCHSAQSDRAVLGARRCRRRSAHRAGRSAPHNTIASSIDGSADRLTGVDGRAAVLLACTRTTSRWRPGGSPTWRGDLEDRPLPCRGSDRQLGDLAATRGVRIAVIRAAATIRRPSLLRPSASRRRSPPPQRRSPRRGRVRARCAFRARRLHRLGVDHPDGGQVLHIGGPRGPETRRLVAPTCPNGSGSAPAIRGATGCETTTLIHPRPSPTGSRGRVGRRSRSRRRAQAPVEVVVQQGLDDSPDDLQADAHRSRLIRSMIDDHRTGGVRRASRPTASSAIADSNDQDLRYTAVNSGCADSHWLQQRFDRSKYPAPGWTSSPRTGPARSEPPYRQPPPIASMSPIVPARFAGSRFRVWRDGDGTDISALRGDRRANRSIAVPSRRDAVLDPGRG